MRPSLAVFDDDRAIAHEGRIELPNITVTGQTIANGTQNVNQGGIAVNTTLNNGGVQNVFVFGTTTGTLFRLNAVPFLAPISPVRTGATVLQRCLIRPERIEA